VTSASAAAPSDGGREHASLDVDRLGDAIVSRSRATSERVERWLYRELQLTLEPGRVVAVLGANGCGKSTLLRRLAGLTESREGRVCWRAGPRSEALATLPARTRARRIAFLPQHTPISDELWVRDVVALGRVPHVGAWGRPTAEDRAAIDQALHAMDLGSLSTRAMASLSGGERQRVLLARMLATQARVWILDEPTTALDVRWSTELHATLRSFARAGHVVVLAMHGVESVAEVADDVLMLGLAREAAPAEHAFGPVGDTLDTVVLERAFGIPFERATSLRPRQRAP